MIRNSNLDPLTETCKFIIFTNFINTFNNRIDNISFYLQYLAQWPDYFVMAESPFGEKKMAYIMGKAEGEGVLWASVSR